VDNRFLRSTLADRTRTKADCLRAALEAVGGVTNSIVMVGDLLDDVHAAHTCGVKAIAVAWGFGAEDDLKRAGPDLIAHSMADVVRWVEARNPIAPTA
jgi:phosphoglycolate phosphatase